MKASKRIRQSNKGFTLMELIIALSLLGFVLAGTFTLFFYIQRSVKLTDVRSAVNQQINMTFLRMQDDIRGASRPNAQTNAVYLKNHDEMHIYSHNENENEYIEIVYRFDPNGRFELQRGWVACTSERPPENESPSYGTITNWETLMNCDSDIYDADSFAFEETVFSQDSGRRAILVTLAGVDKEGILDTAVLAARTFTNRTIGLPE